MKINNVKSNNSFGWSPKVHENITRFALSHIPAKFPHVDYILEGATGAKFPLQHLGILDMRHCYSGQPFSPSGANIKHSLDMYKANLLDSMIDWEMGNEELAMKEIGTALHLLQDIADPIHTRGAFISPLKLHLFKKYNKIADKLDISEVISEKQLNAITDNFYDLYGGTYMSGRKRPNPLRSKYATRTRELVRKSVSSACASTVAFLKRLNNLHIMTDYNKTEAFTSEAPSSRFLSSLEEKI